MKRLQFAFPLICGAFVFIFTSCGGSGSEKTATTDTSSKADTSAKAAVPEPVKSTIITTPQNMAIVMHKVANYAKWKAGYDAHDSARMANGIHNYVIARGLMDSNMVMVALKIDDTTKAMAFAKDPKVKDLMKKAGVIGAPTISLVTATWQDTATLETKLRARTTFTVKDWDAWLKTFEDGKQERMANGITDRVIGHDIHDNKKVNLVTAVSDTAKAFAYYKSPELKKRRELGGVVGEPVRFLFRIVQRY